jgi:transposase
MAEIAKKTKRYPPDLTDGERGRITPSMPRASRRRPRRTAEFRQVINGVRYLARSGCGWRHFNTTIYAPYLSAAAATIHTALTTALPNSNQARPENANPKPQTASFRR